MTGATNLPADMPVFDVPDGLIRILDRDLKVAGIPKRDERDRTIDVHALRHSFGTLLSKGGVAPRTAQAAMRHSSIDLTMNTYTDPKLLDIHGALDSLPALPLSAGPSPHSIDARATGTDDFGPSPLVPTLVPPADNRGDLLPIAATSARRAMGDDRHQSRDVSGSGVKRNNPLPAGDNGCHRERRTGFEPATSSLGS